MNFTPEQMSVFLRRCANGICDDSCPCAKSLTCGEDLMLLAAVVLEEVAEDA